MALSFIGKPISLVSHSDVRYRGILAGIDPQASTIQLSNVYSMGTESRRPATQFIAPVQEPYAYIIFRASEVKDLSVDEPAPIQHNLHDDPAVLGASAPNKAYSPNPQPPPPYVHPTTIPVPAQQQQQPQPPSTQGQPGTGPPAAARAPTQNRRTNPVQNAAASLETVERALGDLRVGGGTSTQPMHLSRGGSGRRGGGHGGRNGRTGGGDELKVPATDFDFAGSNAKFDKAAHSPAAKESTEDGTQVEGDADKTTEKEAAYNPQKSFFDSLSSSAATPPSGPDTQNGNGRRRGGANGGMGRNRREEEREKNVATFGEPGGVGLLGPSGYVGGWGRFGRGRARRGGGANRSGGGQAPVQSRV